MELPALIRFGFIFSDKTSIALFIFFLFSPIAISLAIKESPFSIFPSSKFASINKFASSLILANSFSFLLSIFSFFFALFISFFSNGIYLRLETDLRATSTDIFLAKYLFLLIFVTKTADFLEIITAKTFTLISLGNIIEKPTPIFLGSYTVEKASTASLASLIFQPADFNLPSIVSPLTTFFSLIFLSYSSIVISFSLL